MQEVYYTTPRGDTHAFLWSQSKGLFDLDTLGGKNSYAEALNDAGQVVGMSETRKGQKHAFFWAPSKGMKDLGTLGGSAFSTALGINNRGQVVGFSDLSPDGERELDIHGFIWTPATGMKDLGGYRGRYTAAFAINDRGQIAGSYQSSTEDPHLLHGLLWDPSGRATDLGTLGGKFSVATAINKAGQIVGYSSIPHSDNGAYSHGVITPSSGTGREA